MVLFLLPLLFFGVKAVYKCGVFRVYILCMLAQWCQVCGVISGSPGDSRGTCWEAPWCAFTYSCVTWTRQRCKSRLKEKTTQVWRIQLLILSPRSLQLFPRSTCRYKSTNFICFFSLGDCRETVTLQTNAVQVFLQQLISGLGLMSAGVIVLV